MSEYVVTFDPRPVAGRGALEGLRRMTLADARAVVATAARIPKHGRVIHAETLEETAATPQSGYTPCACRDCMDIAVSSDVNIPAPCLSCKEAGCEPYAPDNADYNALPGYMRDCQRDDAYGA